MGMVECLGRRDSARARVKELKWVNGVEGEKGRESLEDTRGPRSSRIRRIVRLRRASRSGKRILTNPVRADRRGEFEYPISPLR